MRRNRAMLCAAGCVLLFCVMLVICLDATTPRNATAVPGPSHLAKAARPASAQSTGLATTTTMSSTVDWNVPEWDLSGAYIFDTVIAADGSLQSYTVTDSASGAVIASATAPFDTLSGTPFNLPPAVIGAAGGFSFSQPVETMYNQTITVNGVVR